MFREKSHSWSHLRLNGQIHSKDEKQPNQLAATIFNLPFSSIRLWRKYSCNIDSLISSKSCPEIIRKLDVAPQFFGCPKLEGSFVIKLVCLEKGINIVLREIGEILAFIVLTLLILSE